MVDDAGDRAVKLLRSRRSLKIAIVISIITLLTIVMYGWVSWKTWEGIQHVTKSANETRNALFSKLQTNKLTAEKLSEYQADLRNGPHDCNVVVFVSWQENVNDKFKRYRADCQQAVEKNDHIAQSLEEIVSFMNFDKELSGVVRAISDDLSKVKPNDFDIIIKTWTEAKQKIDSGKSERKLRNLLVKRIEAVLSAVHELKAADEKKDGNQFDSARDKLTVAHNALVGTQNELTQVVQTRTDKLLRSF